MDRGEAKDEVTQGPPQGEVAADASERVGEILSKAELEGRAVREAAERDAAATERAAQEEADRLLEEARESARAAGRERADALAALRTALANRGPALLEGLQDAGETRRRVEALMAALDAAAERILETADSDEPVEAPAEASEDGSSNGATPYDGPLPEGAPLARKPRTRQSDVRFAAVLLAVQGQERDEVEQHLRNEYGAADCDPILDEVFGTPA